MIAYEYKAEAIRAVDGDTVDVEVELVNRDFGFETTVIVKRKARLRLFGIDTPERGEPKWAEAKQYVAYWMDVHPVFYIQTFKDRTEKYGRYLANLSVTEDFSDRTLNDALIEFGLAVEYMP